MREHFPRFVFTLLAICSFAAGACAADNAAWHPAAGPLMTRFAKDVSPENCLPEYPRPQLVREAWKNLNGLWDYAITPKDAPQPEKWDGKILVPFAVESALSGVMKPVDAKSRLWYHQSFELPAKWGEQRVLLHFGAVDWETIVSVNGKQVGTHRGGYDGFSFDITDALKASGPQEVIVSVWDPSESGKQPFGKQHFRSIAQPGGIFYTPTTGIWQTVWLEPVPKDGHIESLEITPDIDNHEVLIKVHTTGGSNRPDGDTLTFTIHDGEQDILKTGPTPSGVQRLKISGKMQLWEPGSPFLYNLGVTFNHDRVDSYFGMRKISLGKDEKGIPRILLNNKPIFQVGPLDQGYWPDGIYTAPTDAALKSDIEIAQKLGFNMARKHVKVEPERWYYWCDKLGYLVWQDMPSGNVGNTKTDESKDADAAKQFEAELKAMIDGRRNHPCIVMWVVFNEGWGQYDTPRITEWTKKYDPSRLVNDASGWTDRKAGDVMDMHNYPGPGMPKVEETRAAVLGEFGGLGLGVDGHTWTHKTWGYQGMSSSAALTKKYVQLLQKTFALRDAGLNAAIYTQITDVENEGNGLLTYDREIVKVDVDQVAKANRGQFPPAPTITEIVATAQKQPINWRYTTDKPAEGWEKPDFDASKWKEAPGGFGTNGTPGSTVRTQWKSTDIWLRRDFDLAAAPANEVQLNIHHDEDAEIYINGVLAAKAPGFTTEYELVEISPEARKALKTGKNSVAIHCHQTAGGQYIDAGLVELTPPK
jgi:hypothetical protein